MKSKPKQTPAQVASGIVAARQAKGVAPKQTPAQVASGIVAARQAKTPAPKPTAADIANARPQSQTAKSTSKPLTVMPRKAAQPLPDYLRQDLSNEARAASLPKPTPTRPSAGGPTAPVNMNKLNQVKALTAATPAPTSPVSMRPMKKGGSVGSASKRADGCATKGKTKGRYI